MSQTTISRLAKLALAGLASVPLWGAEPPPASLAAVGAAGGAPSPRWYERFKFKSSPASLPQLAAVDGTQVWTPQSALSRALLANPDVQTALANVQRQDGVKLQTTAALLPRLSLSGTFNRRDDDTIDRSTGELAFPPSLRTAVANRSYDVRLEMRQTVFDGLAGWFQLKRASALSKKAAVDARELYLRVASQVRQAYDLILYRQQMLQTRRDAVRDLTHLAAVAQKRWAAGETSELDSLRAQSALKSAEADLAQGEFDLARAEEGFCRMLNIEKPAQGVRVAGEMVPRTYNEDFSTALSRAQAGRLDIRSAQLQLESANMAQRMAVASFLPRIETVVDYGYRSSYYDVHRRLEGWSVGVMGRWDIFESGQNVGALKVQRAEKRVAEIRLAEAQKLVGSQVRELFAAVDQSKVLMNAHASARDFGGRSLREAQRSFEAGRVSLEQVLNTELAYRQALAGWLGAVYTLNATLYQMDYATANESFLDAAAATR